MDEYRRLGLEAEIIELLRPIEISPPHLELSAMAILTAPLALPKSVFSDVADVFGESVVFLRVGDGLNSLEIGSSEVSGENVQKCIECAAKAENVLLLSPRVSLLQRIAHGDDEGLAEDLALRALLWGKAVHIWLDFTPARFKRNTLFEKTINALDALKDMGAIIKVFQWIDSEKQQKPFDFVTEHDVLKAKETGEWKILCEPRAVITPSARDKAAELGVSITIGI